eukprot:623293-Prymnesium_polylepis.1
MAWLHHRHGDDSIHDQSTQGSSWCLKHPPDWWNHPSEKNALESARLPALDLAGARVGAHQVLPDAMALRATAKRGGWQAVSRGRTRRCSLRSGYLLENVTARTLLEVGTRPVLARWEPCCAHLELGARGVPRLVRHVLERGFARVALGRLQHHRQHVAPAIGAGGAAAQLVPQRRGALAAPRAPGGGGRPVVGLGGAGRAGPENADAEDGPRGAALHRELGRALACHVRARVRPEERHATREVAVEHGRGILDVVEHGRTAPRRHQPVVGAHGAVCVIAVDEAQVVPHAALPRRARRLQLRVEPAAVHVRNVEAAQQLERRRRDILHLDVDRGADKGGAAARAREVGSDHARCPRREDAHLDVAKELRRHAVPAAEELHAQ